MTLLFRGELFISLSIDFLNIPLAPFFGLGSGFARLFLAPRLIGHAKPNQLVLFRVGHRIMGDHFAHHVDLRLHGCLFGVGPVDCRMGTRAPVEHAPSLHFPIVSLGELILALRTSLVNERIPHKKAPPIGGA